MKEMILEDEELLTFKEVEEHTPFGEKAYR